jgi:predicted metal-dependent hydrolase
VTPDWAVATAQDMLDHGRPFHAHEVLEAAWKAAGPAERDLWQGLAQLAVGLTHARRGNARGAVTLLRRGCARLAGHAGTSPHGIDVDGIRGQAAGLAAEIEERGLAAVPAARLRLSLTG